LAESCRKTDWEVHAYCLLRNHFHLVVETPQPNLVFGDWVLGSEAFRQELPASAAGQVGPHHYGAERQETGRQKAERILREELRRMGWREEELRGRSKGQPGKVVIARRLRPETTMSLQWIAERKVDLRVQLAQPAGRGFSSSGGAAVVSIVSSPPAGRVEGGNDLLASEPVERAVPGTVAADV
jgi:hypothetical protein